MHKTRVPSPGSNLPNFRATQLDFAAHIRHPEKHPLPAGVEARRMKIYVDLFYKNIENFAATTFPICKKILGDTRWHALVRQFVELHPSESPYFLEISQEFLTFLNDVHEGNVPGQADRLPDFLLELAHYEWVELCLSVAEEEIPEDGFDADGNLLTSVVLLSPLIWPLTYVYPVHEIGEAFQPKSAPDVPTHLVVYRTREDQVRFMRSNPVTHRLLELLAQGQTGIQALTLIAEELQSPDPQAIIDHGRSVLDKLKSCQIVLGAAST